MNKKRYGRVRQSTETACVLWDTGDAVRGRLGRSVRTRVLLLTCLLPATTLLYAAALPQGHSQAHSTKSAPASSAKAGAGSAAAGFAKDVLPVLQKYCVGCHTGKSAQAGIDLSLAKDAGSVLKDRDSWDRVAQNITSGHMPPTGSPAPTDVQRTTLVSWVQSTTAAADCLLKDPGHVTLHRLNRAEYNNTVRDLCGVDISPADSFPNDDVGYGFDNIGDVLSISPLLMEKYIAVAAKVAHAAFQSPDEMLRPVLFDPARLNYANQSTRAGDHAVLPALNSEAGCDYSFPEAADYLLRAVAYQNQAGPEAAKMQIRLDDKEVAVKNVTSGPRDPKPYEILVHVPAGRHHLSVVFTNPFHDDSLPGSRPQRNRDRRLNLKALAVVGPLQGAGALSPLAKQIGSVPPDAASRSAAARKFLTDFVRRAYRRPAANADVDKLVRCVDLAQSQGETFQQGIEYAMTAAMCSPKFLFRIETDVPGIPHTVKTGIKTPVRTAAKTAGKSGVKTAVLKADAHKYFLNDFALASRLSYFLWSTMPDEELFDLAAKGSLQNPAVLAAQAKRMLKDPRSRALSDNFAGQWLQLRSLDGLSPDTKRFTDFDDGLRQAMKTETELFFQAIVNEDRSVLDFLDAHYTFLNEQLAKHYGIDGVQGADFRRVTLTGDQRGGILTQASLLTVTSNPTRTSPVKRGKWVMENLLGTPLPPAPPNVPVLSDDNHGPLVGTLRQRMEQHRANPACAGCHARMDPIGFGLENYDAVGKWRIADGDTPVDPSGVLPDGSKFSGPSQLRQVLMRKKTLFVHCLADKLMTYALGRGLERTDRCNLDDIVNSTQKDGDRFSALVAAIVQSDPFREQRRDRGE